MRFTKHPVIMLTISANKLCSALNLPDDFLKLVDDVTSADQLASEMASLMKAGFNLTN